MFTLDNTENFSVEQLHVLNQAAALVCEARQCERDQSVDDAVLNSWVSDDSQNSAELLAARALNR